MYEEQIKQFILDELVRNSDTAVLAADENLIDSGVLDSLGIMKLVAFLERKFNIRVSDDEILLNNFESVNAISEFLKGKAD